MAVTFRAMVLPRPVRPQGGQRTVCKQTRELENAEALGGMRNPFASEGKVLKASEAGRLLRERFEATLDKFPYFVHDVESALHPVAPKVYFFRGGIFTSIF